MLFDVVNYLDSCGGDVLLHGAGAGSPRKGTHGSLNFGTSWRSGQP